MSTCSPACSGKTPICSDLNKCVQCLNDAQCTGDTRVCAPDSTCVECTQDNQAYCISSSGVSGFCQNNVCIDGASCTRPTTGKDISVCSKPNAGCFNELTGGLQPCSLDPNMIGFSGGRCIIIADDPSKTGDWCRTSYDCGDPVTRRLRDIDPYGPNPDIISQFGSLCRNTANGNIVNCIEANDADPGSTIGCAGLASASENHECVFCPSTSDKSKCETYIPPDSPDSPTLQFLRSMRKPVTWDF